MIISEEIDDLKRDFLLKEYKILYYKSREIKDLLNEFYESNKELTKENRFLIDEIKKFNDFQEKYKKNEEISEVQRQDINEIKENYKDKEKEVVILQKEIQQKDLDLKEIREKFEMLENDNKKLEDGRQYAEDLRILAKKKEMQIRVIFEEFSIFKKKLKNNNFKGFD